MFLPNNYDSSHSRYNDAFLESKHHSSDSKDRMMKRNKNLTQQVAGTREPSTLVSNTHSFPLNACGLWTLWGQGPVLDQSYPHPYHNRSYQPDNITPKGITKTKPSHFLIFQALETQVLAMESQPEYNCMLHNQFQWLTYFPAVAFVILEHTPFEDPRHWSGAVSLPISWTEALAGAM